MNIDKITKLLILHEDETLYPYDDADEQRVHAPKGKLTIGIGHNLDVHGISRAVSRAIFQEDLDQVVRECNQYIMFFNKLDEVRQAVLLDMSFNLGIQGLLKFTDTMRYIGKQDYYNASKEMLNSQWSRQVGTRAVRLSKMMETGLWPKEIN